MEITLDNYQEQEKLIIEDIQKCDFLSFDLEMTGIAIGGRHFLDSPAERYTKYKISAEKYRIIQLGLVPWFKKNNNGKIAYEAKPYNIYAFLNEDVGHININCEVSALVFNKRHGMNFNTWIRKGVNYVNSKQYNDLIMRTKETNFNVYIPGGPCEKKIVIYKKEDQETYEEFKTKFFEFYNKNEKDKNQEFQYRKLPPFIIYYFLNNLSNDIRESIFISEKIDEDNINKLIIKKVSKEQKEYLLREENQKKIEKLYKCKGIKNLWDEIIKNKKIIVGHNLSLDLLFCYSHFGDTLPDKYEDFKKLIQSSFSGIYDTKLLYNNLAPEKDTKCDSPLDVIYGRLFVSFHNTLEIKIPEGFTNYLLNLKIRNINDDPQNISENPFCDCCDFHQAGFDAFVTGSAFCFLLKNYLANNENIDYKQLEKYNFKITFMKSFYKCFDLRNEEEFIVSNTIPYCLRSLTKSCDFDLEKIINNEDLFSLIKKNNFIEGTNAMLILIDLTKGNFGELETKIMDNGRRYFNVYTLEDFKLMLKDEENQRKDKTKNNRKMSNEINISSHK